MKEDTTVAKAKAEVSGPADQIAPREWRPTMSGSMVAYKPQWKHSSLYKLVNRKSLRLDGGDDWTDVPFSLIRGGLSVMLPDGNQVPVGVPFPRSQPGVLETIYLCGYEQAMALAWTFAAYIASSGGEVSVRAEKYELKYEIKARVTETQVDRGDAKNASASEVE